MNKTVLIIGFIWPEPDATAAGTRMLQLIHFFLNQNYQVYFASSASANELSYDLKSIGVHCFDIKLNHSSFDEKIASLSPEIVLFDRFISEEQYGWRVHESCPDAIRILDTEDLHFLRKSRELAIEDPAHDWKHYLDNDITKREIASIYRSDFSLIISEFEVSLLKNQFKLADQLLLYLPFADDSYSNIDVEQYPKFSERKHFMTLGNFKHKPNHDAAIILKEKIWPLIRKKLPEVEVHVYGAYPSQAIMQLENKNLGFHIKGWISDKSEAFINYRACLAPLRFGAGQKGKLLDAMFFGTPSITTTFGAEGMAEEENWNGFIADDYNEFAKKAVLLYQEQNVWQDSQKKGAHLLKSNFNKSRFKKVLSEKINLIRKDLKSHRERNFIGSMLFHHSMQSSKYFSKWIELKNLTNNKIV